MKKLPEKAALFFEKYEPFHQCLIVCFSSGMGAVVLLTVILMML